jgi:hypothetical protein
VIIRISTEGQYDVDEADVEELNRLDNAAVSTCEAGDEPAFHETYTKLLDFIRSHGSAVDDDHLGASDLILPPPDVTLAEARAEFSGEGLLPN